jgi:hypothetical protein
VFTTSSARASGSDYDRCYHSNLARAVAKELRVTPREVEHQIHDVLNVFMCTCQNRASSLGWPRTSAPLKCLPDVTVLFAHATSAGLSEEYNSHLMRK